MKDHRIAKRRKADKSLVGYLSLGKRRWLPDMLKTKHLILWDEGIIANELNLLKTKHWEPSHEYTYTAEPI